MSIKKWAHLAYTAKCAQTVGSLACAIALCSSVVLHIIRQSQKAFIDCNFTMGKMYCQEFTVAIWKFCPKSHEY
jgi:hypothetical protein